jgi:hypothetical protein
MLPGASWRRAVNEKSMTVVRAKAEAEHARERLLASFHALAAQLAPRKLAAEAWESAKVKGADLAEDAVDAVRRRPVAATGIVAALAMFLAREPLRDGLTRLASKRSGTATDNAPKSPGRPPRRRKRAPAEPRASTRKVETKS